MTDNHKRQKTNTYGSVSANKYIHILASTGDNIHESSSPTSHLMNQYAANSFANSWSMSNNVRSGVQIDTLNSNLYSNQNFHSSDPQYFRIPSRLNPHKNGLCWSTFLLKLQEKEELQKRKLQNTYRTTAETKVVFGVFSFFDLASSTTMPKHQNKSERNIHWTSYESVPWSKWTIWWYT